MKKKNRLPVGLNREQLGIRQTRIENGHDKGEKVKSEERRSIQKERRRKKEGGHFLCGDLTNHYEIQRRSPGA